MKKHLPIVLALVATGSLLAGCVPNAAVGENTTIAVNSTTDECLVEPATVESGEVTFSVTNSGDRVTEFYLLGEDGVSIVTEVEDVAPGSTRDVTILAQPGSYVTECKPGMIGVGVGTATFTVTGDTVDVPAE